MKKVIQRATREITEGRDTLKSLLAKPVSGGGGGEEITDRKLEEHERYVRAVRASEPKTNPLENAPLLPPPTERLAGYVSLWVDLARGVVVLGIEGLDERINVRRDDWERMPYYRREEIAYQLVRRAQQVFTFQDWQYQFGDLSPRGYVVKTPDPVYPGTVCAICEEEACPYPARKAMP